MTAITPRVPRVARFRFRLDGDHALGRALQRVAARRRELPRPPAFLVVCATVAVLNIVGLVMILSASSVAALSDYGSAWYFFERQVMWAALGLVAFVIAARVDYRRWRRWAPALFGATVLLLLAVLVVSEQVNQSHRWFGVGSFGVQPSELAKLALLLGAAQILTLRVDKLHDPRQWRPIVVLFGFVAVLIMMEPDLTSTLVITVIFFALLRP
jgi:cell division protein FtsW